MVLQKEQELGYFRSGDWYIFHDCRFTMSIAIIHIYSAIIEFTSALTTMWPIIVTDYFIWYQSIFVVVKWKFEYEHNCSPGMSQDYLLIKTPATQSYPYEASFTDIVGLLASVNGWISIFVWNNTYRFRTINYGLVNYYSNSAWVNDYIPEISGDEVTDPCPKLIITWFLLVKVAHSQNMSMYSEQSHHLPTCNNTVRPKQNGRQFADDIFKCIFLNWDIWISNKFSLKFVPNGPIDNIPALDQLMAWGLPGDKPLSEPMMVV